MKKLRELFIDASICFLYPLIWLIAACFYVFWWHDHGMESRGFPWKTYRFRTRLWWAGIFGKKMHCGCKGFCRGHVGTISHFRIIVDKNGFFNMYTNFIEKKK